MTPREEKALQELDRHSNELACLTNLREKELQPVSFPQKQYVCSDGSVFVTYVGADEWQKKINAKGIGQ